MKNLSTTTGRRGLTLTELVTVLAIMGFIATLLLLVFNKRMNEARITVAQAECKMLATAEEALAIDFGFYVPLQVLNDLPIQRAGTVFDNVGNQIHLEYNPMNYVINAAQPIQDQLVNQLELRGVDNNGQLDGTGDTRVVRMIRGWKGPYANFQRHFISSLWGGGPTDPAYVRSADARLDFPLDPWGVPYFLYTPYGCTGYDSDNTPTENTMRNGSFGNGTIYTNGDRGDRFAVVSWGPNGEPNSKTGYTSNKPLDDIYYHFGALNSTVNP